MSRIEACATVMTGHPELMTRRVPFKGLRAVQAHYDIYDNMSEEEYMFK